MYNVALKILPKKKNILGIKNMSFYSILRIKFKRKLVYFINIPRAHLGTNARRRRRLSTRICEPVRTSTPRKRYVSPTKMSYLLISVDFIYTLYTYMFIKCTRPPQHSLELGQTFCVIVKKNQSHVI